MVKSVMFCVALVFVAGPNPLPVLANVVPLPSAVAATELQQQMATGEAAQPRSSAPRAPVVSASQRRLVEVLGRSLSLSLMRAERMGLAVLSVPKRSVIANLPDLQPEAFRRLVALESGCMPVGQVQVVSGQGGVYALATGLSCS